MVFDSFSPCVCDQQIMGNKTVAVYSAKELFKHRFVVSKFWNTYGSIFLEVWSISETLATSHIILNSNIDIIFLCLTEPVKCELTL